MLHIRALDLLTLASFLIGCLALSATVHFVLGKVVFIGAQRLAASRFLYVPNSGLVLAAGGEAGSSMALAQECAEADMARALPLCNDWHPLPGYRLALRDSGFEISLEQRSPWNGLFVLWSPEGNGLFAGMDLDELKQAGERQAKFRAEFQPAPTAPAWQPQRRV